MAAEVARLTGFGLVVAPAMDEAFEQRVRNAARGPVSFYVEVHGDDGRESAERIDIATSGGDGGQAIRLQTLFELVRDAHLRGRPPGVRLHVRVEPMDGAARISSVSARALRIHLPRRARHEARGLYAVILADFLREAIALPLPARR
jgi:hypothetical protein